MLKFKKIKMDSQTISLEEIRNYRMQCLQIAKMFVGEDDCVHTLTDDAEYLFGWIYAFELQNKEPAPNSDPESN